MKRSMAASGSRRAGAAGMVCALVVSGFVPGAGPPMAGPQEAGSRGKGQGGPTHRVSTDSPFGAERVWTVHLRLEPAGWNALQPRRSRSTGRPGRRPDTADPAPNRGNRDPARRGPDRPPTDRAPARRRAGGFGLEFEYVAADVEFDGELVSRVGLRYKGNSSFRGAGSSLKRPFKIDFDRFVEDQEFRGVTKLNFANNWMDPEHLRETLGHELLRAAGVPSPRTAFARVYLTVEGELERRYLGLYTMVEQVDRRFLRSRFDTREGLLLKPERVGGITHLGDRWDAYEALYAPKSGDTPATALRLASFTRLVDLADDATFRHSVRSWIDLAAFARFLAANVIMANYDSFIGSDHNYYLYFHPDSGRVHWIPWDLNHAFGGFPLAGPMEEQIELSVERFFMGRQRLLERLVKLEAFRRAYRAALEELAATVFAPETLKARIHALAALLQPILEEEPVREPGERSGVGRSHPRRRGPDSFLPLEVFVERRMGSVSAQLRGDIEGRIPRGRFARPRPPGAALLAAADTDHDGAASRDEFRALSIGWFAEWNTRADEALDEDELARGLATVLPPPPGPPGGREPRSGEGAPAPWRPPRFLVIRLFSPAGEDELTPLGAGALLDRLDHWFGEWDADGDGRVVEPEILGGLERVLHEARPGPRSGARGPAPPRIGDGERPGRSPGGR